MAVERTPLYSRFVSKCLSYDRILFWPESRDILCEQGGRVVGDQAVREIYRRKELKRQPVIRDITYKMSVTAYDDRRPVLFTVSEDREAVFPCIDTACIGDEGGIVELD